MFGNVFISSKHFVCAKFIRLFRLAVLFGGGSAGLLAGMAAMIYFYIKGEGWSGLIGPFVLIELTLAGLGIGLVLQFVHYMIEKYRKL